MTTPTAPAVQLVCLVHGGEVMVLVTRTPRRVPCLQCRRTCVILYLN